MTMFTLGSSAGCFRGQLGTAPELSLVYFVDVRAGKAVRGDQPYSDSSRLPSVANVQAQHGLPDGDLAGKRLHRTFEATLHIVDQHRANSILQIWGVFHNYSFPLWMELVTSQSAIFAELEVF